ncbi:MAG: transposase-like protein [Akkermansiaceae bacterium]|jgi:transposase-like protein
MKGKIRRHDPEFKARVAIEALKKLRTASEPPKEFQIHPAQISDWKKQMLDAATDFFGAGKKKSNEAIQLVNSWPDLSLDESLNHRPRPERLPHGPRPHRQQGPLRTHARLCQQFNPATQGGRRMDHGPDLLVDLSSLPLFLVVHFQRSNQLVSHFAGFLKNKFVCGASMDHKNHGVSFPSKY